MRRGRGKQNGRLARRLELTPRRAALTMGRMRLPAPCRCRLSALPIAVVLLTAACVVDPARTQTHEARVAQHVDERHGRIEALRTLFGQHLKLTPRMDGATTLAAALRIGRFDDDAVRLFTPIGGIWAYQDGRAVGKALSVSQLLCLVPWRTEKLSVRAGIDATGVCELNLYDPVADRLTGADGVGKAHFGRMHGESDTDWFDVSTRDRREPPNWDAVFPPGPQPVKLLLDGKSLTGTVVVGGTAHTITRTLEPEDPPAIVYVGVAGGVMNTVSIASLEIDGEIDLAASTTTVLTGMGAAFWGDGREVTLLYNAGGCFHRLLVNGIVVAEAVESTRWTDMQDQLYETTVMLRHGDVIGVELADADDETALLLAGIDVQTRRTIIATHPLVWAQAPDPFDDTWFSGAPPTEPRPRAGSGGYGEALTAFRLRLGAPFPGLPIAGPTAPRSRVAFRHVVR